MCSVIIVFVLNLNLNQQLVVLALLRKLLCLVQSLRLLSAYLNGGIDIEDAVTLSLIGFGNQLRDFIVLFHFNITIQQKSSVVLVVVSQGIHVLDVR